MYSEETDIYNVYAEYIDHIISNVGNKKIGFFTVDINNLRYMMEIMERYSPLTTKMKTFTFKNSVELNFYVAHKKLNFDLHQYEYDYYIMDDLSKEEPVVIKRIHEQILPIVVNRDGAIVISAKAGGNMAFARVFCESEKGHNVWSPFRYYYWMCNDVDNDWISTRLKINGPYNYSVMYDLYLKV